jgi:hypothetical protein
MGSEAKNMNKRSIRSFAFGILMTVCIIGFVSFFQEEPKPESSTIEDAKALLKKSGYVILSVTEFNDLQNQAPAQEKKAEQNVQETETPADPINHYQLEITSGITPSEISALLKENHIIENESEFTDFLINQNYHTKIQLGSYALTNQMTHEQIADIITKR